MIRIRLQRFLNCRILYLLLIVISGLYVGLNLSIERFSKLEEGDKVFIGNLKKLTVDDEKAKFTIDLGNEDLICNYYFNIGIDPIEFMNNYKIGSSVEIKGDLKKPINNTIPNTFNYKKYLYYHNIFYTCNAEEISIKNEKTNIFYTIKNAVVKRILSFDIKDYMYTMIVGDKSLLDEETFQNFKKNGVTHLFAISGMHIGLFSAFLLKVLKKLKNKKRYFIVILFIWFYAFLVGFTPSVLRSCLLFSLIAIFKLCNIKVSTLKVLILTSFILIFINPFIIMDIGFVYSFLTTFGLIYSSTILNKHRILGTSLVANLYSLPITINNFYKVNFMSILFNIVFVPFVSIIIYPLCLLTFVFRFLEPLTSLSIFFLEFLNNWCSKIDFMYLVIPKLNIFIAILYYAILLIFLKKKVYVVSGILIILVLSNKVYPILDTNYHIDFLDVGQGDSTLIRSPSSKEVILIDTGGLESYKSGKSPEYHVASNTVTYLNSLGINRIDFLILTHGDADHLGDALYLMDNIEVTKVMLNGGTLNENEQKIIDTGIEIVDKYNGKLDIEFLNDKDWNDENSNSIVTSLKLDGIHFIFMGDATRDVEKYILENKALEKVDILKLGHHGSKTSSDKTFLEKLKVKKAIISAGRNNKYNHPSLETLNTLKELSIDYLSTQTSGTVSLKINKYGITESAYPP